MTYRITRRKEVLLCHYIDLSLLAKVNGAVKNGTAVDLSSWHPEDAKNSFTGTSVESIVLEVSHQHPQLKPGARIGVWCATKLATDAGGWRQINRGGHPMMWPIFWPDDTHFTNPANTRHPSKDFDAEGAHIAEHIAAVVAASGTSGDPHGYGQTVSRELFPDVLPYVARDIRLRWAQRPDVGRQRTRSHAVPRRRHGCALRIDAGGREEPTARQVSVRRASITICGCHYQGNYTLVGHA
jgi:hypothetical protein